MRPLKACGAEKRSRYEETLTSECRTVLPLLTVALFVLWALFHNPFVGFGFIVHDDRVARFLHKREWQREVKGPQGPAALLCESFDQADSNVTLPIFLKPRNLLKG